MYNSSELMSTEVFGLMNVVLLQYLRDFVEILQKIYLFLSTKSCSHALTLHLLSFNSVRFQSQI